MIDTNVLLRAIMQPVADDRLIVGEGEESRPIALKQRDGAKPGILWLGGFMSDMDGTKARTLDEWADASGRACTRFDYSGHGASGGSIEDGTISRWLEEALAVFDSCTEGPQILVGSSMGGWLALLLAEQRRAFGRIAGMVLIAPAFDMTKTLMWDTYPKAVREEIARNGVYRQPNDYSEESYVITRKLLEDGERHLVGDRLIETGCPVHILQGAQDRDVPPAHAASLMARLSGDDVVLTLVKDGDHRMSRPEDLERLIAAIDGLIAESPSFAPSLEP